MCTTRAWGRWRAVSANDAATTRARRASRRVARPGTAFCSSSTTGIRCAIAAATTGTETYPPTPTTTSGRIRRTSRRAAMVARVSCGRRTGDAGGAADVDAAHIEGLEAESRGHHQALGHAVTAADHGHLVVRPGVSQRQRDRQRRGQVAPRSPQLSTCARFVVPCRRPWAEMLSRMPMPTRVVASEVPP